MHQKQVYAGLALFFLCSSTSAIAARVVALTTEELTDAADIVVRARVLLAVAERPAHNPRRIRTRITLATDEWLKRPAQYQNTSGLVFFVPGGEVGRFGQKVPGAPQIPPGVEVVVYLRFDARGELQVVGLAQGVYFIDYKSNPVRAVRQNIGVHYVSRTGGGAEVHRAPEERIPLDELLNRIRRRSLSREAQ